MNLLRPLKHTRETSQGRLPRPPHLREELTVGTHNPAPLRPTQVCESLTNRHVQAIQITSCWKLNTVNTPLRIDPYTKENFL